MQLDLEELILLQGDTHANHSVKQVGDKAKKMNVISGQKCYELSKVANHDTFWLKMLLVMSQWASTKCLLTWKIKDTPQGRLLYQLVPKTHHIDETEFGSSDNLLPTPTTQEIEHPEATLTKNNRRLSKDGKSSHSLNLADTMMLWPTPRSSNLMNQQMTPELANRNKGNLEEVVAEKMWPTPRARDYKDGSSVPPSVIKGTRSATLGQQVALDKTMFPTPTANEDAAGRPGGKMQKMLGNDPKVRNTGVGTLNSEWVTWLMGYPEGYLDISTENQTISQELQKEKKTEPKS